MATTNNAQNTSWFDDISNIIKEVQQPVSPIGYATKVAATAGANLVSDMQKMVENLQASQQQTRQQFSTHVETNSAVTYPSISSFDSSSVRVSPPSHEPRYPYGRPFPTNPIQVNPTSPSDEQPGFFEPVFNGDIESKSNNSIVDKIHNDIADKYGISNEMLDVCKVAAFKDMLKQEDEHPNRIDDHGIKESYENYIELAQYINTINESCKNDPNQDPKHLEIKRVMSLGTILDVGDIDEDMLENFLDAQNELESYNEIRYENGTPTNQNAVTGDEIKAAIQYPYVALAISDVSQCEEMREVYSRKCTSLENLLKAMDDENYQCYWADADDVYSGMRDMYNSEDFEKNLAEIRADKDNPDSKILDIADNMDRFGTYSDEFDRQKISTVEGYQTTPPPRMTMAYNETYQKENLDSVPSSQIDSYTESLANAIKVGQTAANTGRGYELDFDTNENTSPDASFDSYSE